MSLLGTSILVVEDNDAQYRDVEQVLFNNQPDGMVIKYVLKRADTLQSALLYVSGGYDLILLDLNLPDSAGMRTFEQIKPLADKQFGGIPIIVTTVLEDMKIGLECYRSGAAGYIVKSWLNGNPLLLHFVILSSIETTRQAQKLQTLMAERVGQNRPLLQRCKSCQTRAKYSRWKSERDGKWLYPDEYIEASGLNFTDGVCPECFDVIYKPLLGT